MWNELRAAINNKDAAKAVRLIEQISPQDFDQDYWNKHSFGQTPLHAATIYGLVDVVELLLNKKFDLINIVDHAGKTALHYAAAGGHQEVFSELSQRNPALIGVLDRGGKTALHWAMSQVQYQVAGICSPEMLVTVLRLNNKNSNDPQVQKFLNSAIAVYNNDITANANNANAYFKKANVLYALNIHEEAIRNYEKALELDEATYIEKIILNMSVNLVNENINGQTALHIAAFNGYDGMTKIMLNKIDHQIINGFDKDGKTILYKAAESCRERAVELLVGKMNTQAIGRTLIKATKEGNKVVAKTLVKKITPEILAYQEVNGKTALHWAIQHSHDEIAEILLEKMSKEAVLLEDNRGRTAWHLSSNDAVADKIIQKIGQELPAINKFSSTTTKAENSNSNNNNSESSKAREQKVISSTQKKAISYSAEEIKKLLDIQIGKQATVKMVDLRQGKLEPVKVRELVKPVLEEDKIVAAVLQISDQSYTSLLVKKNGDVLQIIHNDPKGLAFTEEKNVKSLIRGIKDLEDAVSTIDLAQKQILEAEDCAAFVVDNLVTLVKNSTKDLKKPELQKLLSTSQQIENIKVIHSLIGDINPWYNDEKLKKLLEIELKDKEVYISPIIILENKASSTEIIQMTTKTVMCSDNPAVIPVRVHGNCWTGLVIKKQAGGLQAIYNDPKSDKLTSQRHSGTLLKAIGKICSKFTIIDLQKHQQAHDEDCGVFTVDNLVKLALCSANSTTEAMKGLLATADINGRADDLRIQHENELCEAGIPVRYVDIDLTGNSTPTDDFIPV